MKKIDFQDFKRVFDYVKPNKPAYWGILALDCTVELSLVQLVPVIIKISLDAAIKSDMQMIRTSLIITLIVCFSGMGLFAISQFYLFRSFYMTTASIRNLIFRTILNLPVEYVEKNHSGDTLSRLTNDVGKMQGAYGWQLRMMIVNLLTGFTAVLLMFLMDWKLCLILLAISSVSVYINIRQRDQFRKYNDEIQKEMGKYTENLSNIIGGFLTIKSLLFEPFMQGRAEEINRKIFESNIQLTKKNAFISARNFLFGAINFTGVIILGSYLALNGISSLGSVASMVILLGRVNRMFGQINDMVVQLQGYLAGAERVFGMAGTRIETDRIEVDGVETEGIGGGGAESKPIDTVSVEPGIASCDKPMNPAGLAIAMRDIHFSYDGRNNALEGINLTVGKGQVAALVGPSGGGKSTVIKLILGYYPPASGRMTVGGRALRDMTVKELREQIAYVPQDAYVFDGSIRENIRYGRTDATDEEIEEAARAAYADEFIREMPEGYDTLVGERGIKLSGGQRQRIAIARAFLKNAPILLLDEATSSLDSKSEQQVQDALNTLMRGKTALIIAHRLSTIEHADVIYLVENGRIAEQGNHSELLELGGIYRTLYEKQFRVNEQLAS